MLYAKVGAAVVDNRFFHTVTASTALINSTMDSRWGGSIGAGIEYGSAPNWAIGLECDRLFLGRDTLSFAPAPGGLATRKSIGQDVDLLTARVNYRFGGSLVAHY